MGMRAHQHQSSSSSSIDSNTNSFSHEYDDRDHRRCRRAYGDTLSQSSASCSSSSWSFNASKYYNYAKDLSTDLRLGLSISSLSDDQHDLSSSSSPTRGQYSDWPPIKPLLRSTLGEKSSINRRAENNLFVKVYMDGIPIGRKLDLLAHDGYESMITTLSHMFKTTILYPDISHHSSSEKYHILTYEDKEGDWMMVGDVPWEMFLTSVKRLKIATLDNCQ